MIEITFFVPCYNEERYIAQTLADLMRMMRDKGISYEILVVDDGSTDSSVQSVKMFIGEHPDIRIAHHVQPVNLGLGCNYLQFAKEAKGDYYMLVNGDNDIPMGSLAYIVENRKRAEIIIPFVENQEDRPWIRRSLSYFFTFLVNALSGNKLKYYNGPVLQDRKSTRLNSSH